MEGLFNGGTLIPDSDSWLLWSVLLIIVAVSIFMEQKFKWAAKFSAPVICIIIGLVAANLKLIPVAAPVYTTTAVYCIPLATAMMLFQANIKKIIKNSGKMFICMNISIVATLIGAVAAFFLMKGMLPEVNNMAGAVAGSFIGGTANFLAVASSTGMSETMTSTGTFAVNFAMTLAIVVLLWIPSSNFFKARFPHPYQKELEEELGTTDSGSASAKFWSAKEISLLDIAKTCGTAFVIVSAARKLASFFGGLLAVEAGASAVAEIPVLIFGNQYVMMTLVAIVAVAVLPKYFENLKGAHEIGTFLIYIYFVVIGCSVNLHDAASNIIPIVIFCCIAAFVNVSFTLLGGKVAKQNVEELTISSNAALGGPFTAMAMAVSKGYEKLIVPALLAGIWGNTLGTILGVTLFAVLGVFM